MLSVRAIFDGKNITLVDKIKVTSPQKIIITFLDENYDEITTEELAKMATKGKSFDFMKNKKEDIYSDDDLKVKYR